MWYGCYRYEMIAKAGNFSAKNQDWISVKCLRLMKSDDIRYIYTCWYNICVETSKIIIFSCTFGIFEAFRRHTLPITYFGTRKKWATQTYTQTHTHTPHKRRYFRNPFQFSIRYRMFLNASIYRTAKMSLRAHCNQRTIASERQVIVKSKILARATFSLIHRNTVDYVTVFFFRFRLAFVVYDVIDICSLARTLFTHRHTHTNTRMLPLNVIISSKYVVTNDYEQF